MSCGDKTMKCCDGARMTQILYGGSLFTCVVHQLASVLYAGEIELVCS